jgi:hypothetical protein
MHKYKTNNEVVRRVCVCVCIYIYIIHNSIHVLACYMDSYIIRVMTLTNQALTFLCLAINNSFCKWLSCAEDMFIILTSVLACFSCCQMPVLSACLGLYWPLAPTFLLCRVIPLHSCSHMEVSAIWYSTVITMGTGDPFPGIKRGRGVTMTTHLRLAPRSKMSRNKTPLPLGTFMVVAGQFYYAFYVVAITALFPYLK